MLSRDSLTHLLRRLVLPAVLLSFSSHINASTGRIDELLNQADRDQLWRQAEWLNLLHYQLDSGHDAAYISQVDDARFFNAHDGKSDPQAELAETLRAFFRVADKAVQHPQCRFVARLNWLKAKLKISDDELPTTSCPDYEDWRKQIKADRVTLVFPAYHLNSPSSMFGHTLFRLDPKKDEDWSEWLSFAVNFGANIEKSDDSIAYAIKGLTGGYPGIFIVTPYYNKIQEYNRIENRDIWEYELNLTQAETERMVQHLWELKEINFDYYFFDENCSYRLLELLEVARPGLELTDEFSLSAIPVDTVRAMQRQGLITDSHYRPSQLTLLEYYLDMLSATELQLVKELSIDMDTASSERFSALAPDRQKLVTKTAYEHLRYHKKSERRDTESSKQSYRLLRLLSSYPKQLKIPQTPTLPSDPVLGHESRRLNLALGNDEAGNDFIELGYKFSFHDLIDNETGFLRGAQINLGKLLFRLDDEGIDLQRFDVVDIFSLTPRTDFFDPLSWKILTGLERQWSNGRNKLVAHLSGGAGVSYDLTDNTMFYSLLIARLERNTEFSNGIEAAAGMLNGLLGHLENGSYKFELGGERFSRNRYRIRAGYEHNLVISRNHSVVLRLSKQWQQSSETDSVRLSYQYYF